MDWNIEFFFFAGVFIALALIVVTFIVWSIMDERTYAQEEKNLEEAIDSDPILN